MYSVYDRHRLQVKIFIFYLITFLVALLIIFLLFALSNDSKREHNPNYCDPKLCPPGQRHVACRKITFSNACVHPTRRNLSTQHIEAIIHNHNQFRNELATGKVSGLKPAKRLGTVTWDNDLAYLGATVSMYCSLRTDRCYNTKKYPHVGQNIAILHPVGGKEVTSDQIDETLRSMIDQWFSEHATANQGLMNFYNKKTGSNIRSFANMMHERTTKIGCGLTTSIGRHKKLMYVFVCNYSFQPYHGLSIYSAGSSCSNCETGCHSTYEGLCNLEENIKSDIDNKS